MFAGIGRTEKPLFTSNTIESDLVYDHEQQWKTCNFFLTRLLLIGKHVYIEAWKIPFQKEYQTESLFLFYSLTGYLSKSEKYYGKAN